LNETMKVATQMIAKIKNDSKISKQNPDHPHRIDGFVFSSVKGNKVTNLFDNWHGYRVEFAMNLSFTNNLVLDDSDWLHDTVYTLDS
jgi:Na+-transporting NADH:ubiquinone oxidoreductase subunit NqrC